MRDDQCPRCPTTTRPAGVCPHGVARGVDRVYPVLVAPTRRHRPHTTPEPAHVVWRTDAERTPPY